MREIAELQRTKLVAVTGYGRTEDRRRSHEAGFDHHLIKPVSRQTLAELFAEQVSP
jgi:CheY-like chemotaxis protein